MSALMSGRVSDRPFPKVLYALCAHRFSGVLVLEQDGRTWKVFWKDGLVVDAESASPEDSLPRALVAEGLLQPNEVGELLRRMAQEQGKKPSEIFAAMKNLEPGAAERAARVGLVTRARRIFALPEAEFHCEDTPHQRLDGGPVDPRWLIHRGLRAHYDAARLGRDLAPLEAYAIKLDGGHEDALVSFAFGDEERFVMAYLAKGYWALPDLVEACMGLPVTTIHALVYTLLACELLDVKPAGSVPRLRKRAREDTLNVGPAAAAALGKAQAAKPAAPARAAPSASLPPPEAAAIRAQIMAKVALIDGGGDHFAVLELPRSASTADAKVAYFKLAKVFHPDRVSAMKLHDLQPLVERTFSRITTAFNVLSDEGKRADYLKILAAGGEEAVKRREAAEEAKALKIIGAEDQFNQGEMALRRGNQAAALEHFRRALEGNPDEAEHHAYHAWALFLANKDAMLAPAKQQLAKALELNPSCAPAYYFLGQIYNHQQDFARSIAQFQKAIELRPGYSEAEQELRVLEMRRQKGALAPGKAGSSLNPFRKK